MKPNIDYSLYLVTDSELASVSALELAVEQAIKGGCTLVQLREKKLSSLEFYNLAVKVKHMTDKYNIPLIINDRTDIALAVGASGVHIGQQDLPAKKVRAMIGDNKILGVSASSLTEALQAEKDGADYLGVGAMFATGTKADANIVTLLQLKTIKAAVNLPVIAIGGINKSTIPQFAGTEVDGIAVVSAIISEQDIMSAAAGLKNLFVRTMDKQC